TDQHDEIGQLAVARRIPWRDHLLDQHQRPSRLDHATAVAQRRGGPLVIPVMDHPGKHVGVATLGDFREHVPTPNMATTSYTPVRNEADRPRDVISLPCMMCAVPG